MQACLKYGPRLLGCIGSYSTVVVRMMHLLYLLLDWNNSMRCLVVSLPQVFSNDSILQLVPHAVIPLLQAYSMGGAPDHRLQPPIPALSLLFQESDREDPIPKLGNLCGTLGDRAQSVYNDWSKAERQLRRQRNLLCSYPNNTRRRRDAIMVGLHCITDHFMRAEMMKTDLTALVKLIPVVSSTLPTARQI